MLHLWGDRVQHLWLSAQGRLWIAQPACSCACVVASKSCCVPTAITASCIAVHLARPPAATNTGGTAPSVTRTAAADASSMRRARLAGADVNKVTHQGCPPMQADASLSACKTTNACEPIDLPSSAADVVLPSATAPVWTAPRCGLCGCAVRPHVRLGWLRRRAAALGGQHDHWP